MICGIEKINRKRMAVALVLFLSPSALFAQGCAMCYQSAASSGSQFIQALRHGILIMFFPPILIMGLIYYAAYCKRNQFNTDENVLTAGGASNEDRPSDWILADEVNIGKLVEDDR
jgi:hypothetical protein